MRIAYVKLSHIVWFSVKLFFNWMAMTKKCAIHSSFCRQNKHMTVYFINIVSIGMMFFICLLSQHVNSGWVDIRRRKIIDYVWNWVWHFFLYLLKINIELSSFMCLMISMIAPTFYGWNGKNTLILLRFLFSFPVRMFRILFRANFPFFSFSSKLPLNALFSLSDQSDKQNAIYFNWHFLFALAHTQTNITTNDDWRPISCVWFFY